LNGLFLLRHPDNGKAPFPDFLEKTVAIVNEMVDANFENTIFRLWGTGNLGYDVGARLSSEPVLNWQEEWHNEKSYGGDQFERNRK